MQHDFEGRLVVVTGAAGNVGTAVCRRLAGAGAQVFALVRDEAERDRLSRHAIAGVTIQQAELTDEASVEAAFDAATRGGKLWAVAHVAGAWMGGAPLAKTELSLLDQMLNINLRTTFLVNRAAMRRMEGPGRIVNVAAYTAASGIGSSGSSAYVASKGGVIALTKAVAEEGAPRGIRASCVAPGTIRTPDNERGMPKADHSRWVPLEAVAEAIAFLASPLSEGVNGAVVPLPSK